MEFPKARGTAGIKGIDYQLNLTTIVLLNALLKLKGIKWMLSTEHKLAGKFNDIVFEEPDGAFLFQAKNRENKKKIKLEELLSTNSRKDSFSLPKYFLSYLEIKDKFKIKNLFLCSNVKIEDNEKQFLQKHTIPEKSLLYYSYPKDTHYLYTFKIDVVTFSEKAREYLTKNPNEKRIHKEAITHEIIADFFKKFIFYTSYPAKSDFEAYINQLLSSLKSSNTLFQNIFFQDIHKKVKEWFEQGKGKCLTESTAEDLFREIKSKKCCETLENYNVVFSQNDFKLVDLKHIHLVTIEGGHTLHLLKIFQALKNESSKVLYVTPDHDVDVQRQIIELFQQSKYTILVAVCITEESAINAICRQIQQILDQQSYKKIVVIGEIHNVLAKKLLFHYDVMKTTSSVIFDNLSIETQSRLLESNNIKFQETSISLRELLKPLAQRDFKKYLSCQLLERLVKNDTISVGSKITPLKKEIQFCYITRSFKRPRNDTPYSEKEIRFEREKVILINDCAGTGKSTVITKLATDIKNTNKYLWVIKIDLTGCTRILKEAVKENRETVSIEELLGRSFDKFEKSIFFIKEKIVLLLDGVNEISPDYTKLIINLLIQCQNAPNFKKIFVTTRPNASHKLEEMLIVTPFMLQPLTVANQIKFLTDYWVFNLKLMRANDINKCEMYAKLLLKKVSSWTHFNASEYDLAGVPLLVRMLAEIFLQTNSSEETSEWEGCREFLGSNTVELKLPKNINMSKLYDMFVQKKQEVYMNKGNPNENLIARQALVEQFNRCMLHHEILAIEIIFGEVCGYFTSHKEEIKKMDTLTKIGFIQELNGEFQFTHLTFIEYFAAKALVRELQNENATPEFKNFLIRYLMEKHKFWDKIIEFFDSCLSEVGDSLRSDVFLQYESQKYEIDKNIFEQSVSIIHNLAEKNMIFILKFLLKCLRNTEEGNTKNKKNFIRDFRKINFEEQSRSGIIYENIYNILRLLIKDGINIIHDNAYNSYYGKTPLHVAIQEGHLQMVEFLLSQGSNVYMEDIGGCTSLMLAAQCGHFKIVKLLVTRHNVNVNTQNKDGDTALHKATSCRHWEIVNYLVENGADVNIKNILGNTALHTAASENYPEIFELLVAKNADITSKNIDGDTALHRAALYGNSDIVKLFKNQMTAADIRNRNGDTPLHIATSRNCTEIVELLMQYGANVNIQNIHGDTPLHRASFFRHFNIYHLLVKNGANVTITNRNGDPACYFS